MRFLIGFLFFFLFSKSVLATATDHLLGKIGALDFIENVKKIKSLDNPSLIRPENTTLKIYANVWPLYSILSTSSYYVNIKEKLSYGFSDEEISYFSQTFENPFINKVLRRLTFESNIFDLFNQVKFEGQLTLPSESIRPSYNELYTLLGGNAILNTCIRIMDGDIANSRQIISYNPITKEKMYFSNALMNERRSQAKEFVIMNLFINLKGMRKTEFEYFLSTIKKDEKLKSFVQVIFQYHYQYILKFLDELSKKVRDEDS